MAKITKNNDGSFSIAIHGRDCFDEPFDYWDVVDGAEVQIDISARPLRFEVDGVPLNAPLEANPDDPKGQRIVLTNSQVASLKTDPTQFTVRDESNIVDGKAKVLWFGSIKRFGYANEPDTVDG